MDDADKTLRILLGQNKRLNLNDKIEAACLENNIALNIGKERSQRALDKYARPGLTQLLKASGIDEQELFEETDDAIPDQTPPSH